MFRTILDQLSIEDLARAAEVNKFRRKEATAATVKKRADVAALVKVSAGVPDSALTGPQLALRSIQRTLSCKDPFSSLPLPFKIPDFEADMDVDEEIVHSSATYGRFKAIYKRSPGGLELRECKLKLLDNDWCGVTFVQTWQGQVGASTDYKIDSVEIRLHPNPLVQGDCLWMQGLLLALTGGFEGLLRDGHPASTRGELSCCKRFTVMWNGDVLALPSVLRDFWPIPVRYLQAPVRPTMEEQHEIGGRWVQIFSNRWPLEDEK